MKSQPYSVRFDLQKDKDLLDFIEKYGLTETINKLWANYKKNNQTKHIEDIINEKMDILIKRISTNGVVIATIPQESQIEDKKLSNTAKSIIKGFGGYLK